MTTPGKFFALALTVTAFFLISCNDGNDGDADASPSADSNVVAAGGDAAKRHGIIQVEKTYPIPGEDTIDLSLSEVPGPVAVPEIERANSQFSLSGQGLPYVCGFIDTGLVRKIHNEATAINGTCNSKVTGVKIYMGAVLSGGIYKMKLLFKPVLLCYASETTVNNEIIVTYNVSEGTECHEYNPSVQDCADLGRDTSLYIRNIRFANGAQGRKHNGLNTIAGDVTSLIYSCQELFAVMRDNSQSDSLLIWNCERRVDGTGGAFYLKHSLLISGEQPDMVPFTKEMISGFRGIYADRANLCPPDCQSVTFTILRNQPE